MPVNLSYTITNNSFLVNGSEALKSKVQDAIKKGLYEGGDELRDYIKNDLLSGQLVKKRTGQLRNSLWVQRNKTSIKILFRGTHTKPGSDGEWDIPNSVLAEILEYGLKKTWFQPKRNYWHPGIKPHYFMRTGLKKKKARIISLVQFHVNSALRSKTRG